MSSLTLTTTREVSPEEVDDLIELIDFSRSPWFKSIEQGRNWFLVEHDPRERDGITDTSEVYRQQILDAATAAQPQLCCSLTEGEGLGFLCANDADIILQTAIFGRIIFG